MTLKLYETAMTYHVFDEAAHHSWAHCIGEVTVRLDDVDIAWVEPCHRLHMNEEVIDAIAQKLRPLGVKWMRGWGNGGREGRVLTANGPVSCEPWSEVYDDEGTNPG